MPTAMVQSLERYHLEHKPTGGFLRSVLAGELYAAVLRADPESEKGFCALVRFIMRTLPAESWGSREKVDAWLEARP